MEGHLLTPPAPPGVKDAREHLLFASRGAEDKVKSRAKERHDISPIFRLDQVYRARTPPSLAAPCTGHGC